MDGPAAVVIDNGTGYTKMGYAGNFEPSYMIPSCIATAQQKVSTTSSLKLFRKHNPWPTPHSEILTWISILEMRPMITNNLTTSSISWRPVRYVTGKESKNTGTDPSTTTSNANQRSTDLSWLNLPLTPPKIVSKWQKSCSKHLMSRVCSLVCRLLSLFSRKWAKLKKMKATSQKK